MTSWTSMTLMLVKLTGRSLIRPSRTRLIETIGSLSVGLPLQNHRCVNTNLSPQSRCTFVQIPIKVQRTKHTTLEEPDHWNAAVCCSSSTVVSQWSSLTLLYIAPEVPSTVASNFLSLPWLPTSNWPLYLSMNLIQRTVFFWKLCNWNICDLCLPPKTVYVCIWPRTISS